MEAGDIGVSSRIGQACVFEGVLASPPIGVALIKEKYHIRRGSWDDALKLWTPNELPLKSLIDSSERMGIATDIITFLDADATEPMYRWLVRKGIHLAVVHYDTPELYAEDLKFNRGIKVVYTPNKEIAYTLGMRATVVSPKSAWRL